jgi:predicted DCC family thiol-disulfide oxidoreductase YuxK
MTTPVWLFDGHCVLCSAGVRYILKHEFHHEVHFVAIQSREGRALAELHGIDPEDPESFLFIEHGRALAKSDGVLALLKHAGGPAQALRIACLLPRTLRDWIYDLVAHNRYGLFGKRDDCLVLQPHERHRFVLPEPHS